MALGAYLSGPHHFAVAVRGFCINVLAGLRGFADQAGPMAGPVTAWLYRFDAWVIWTVLLIGTAAFVVRDDPTVPFVLLATLSLLVVLAVLEFLAPSGRFGGIVPVQARSLALARWNSSSLSVPSALRSASLRSSSAWPPGSSALGTPAAERM